MEEKDTFTIEKSSIPTIVSDEVLDEETKKKNILKAKKKAEKEAKAAFERKEQDDIQRYLN